MRKWWVHATGKTGTDQKLQNLDWLFGHIHIAESMVLPFRRGTGTDIWSATMGTGDHGSDDVIIPLYHLRHQVPLGIGR